MDYHSKYDIIGFANDLGLSIREVSELYVELIYELNSALSELRVLITKEDIIKIQKIIHNIKGVCGNYRITDIYEETKKINNSLKTVLYTELEKDLNHLFNIIHIAIKDIQSFFNQKSIFI